MAKAKKITTKKRGRPRKVKEAPLPKAKKVSAPKVKKISLPKAKKISISKERISPPVIKPKPVIKPERLPEYKQEIVVLGKKVKRLNDGRDTDLQFHCRVDDETTAHFDKELFKQ